MANSSHPQLPAALIFCLFLALPLFSQSPRPGSPPGRSPEEIKKGIVLLNEQLGKAATDTAKTRLTLGLANLTAYQDLNAGLELSNDAIVLAKKSGDEKAILNSYMAMGGILQRANKFDEALEYFKKALPHIEKAKEPELAGVCYGNIAQIYMRQGVYEKALDYYQKSLAEFEKQQTSSDSKAMTLQQIGTLFLKMNRPKEALPYFERALLIWEKAQNWARIDRCYRNMGVAYHQLGEDAMEAETYEKAEKAGGRLKKKD